MTQTWTITVPTWRATKDISIREDLAEEIMRIRDYDTIPRTSLPVKMQPVTQRNEWQWQRFIENTFISNNFNETRTYSMANRELSQKTFIPIEKCIKILNPLSEDHALVMPTPLPHLLAEASNIFSREQSVQNFTIGRGFFGVDEHDQKTLAIAILAGTKNNFLTLRDAVVRATGTKKYSRTEIESAHPNIGINFKNDVAKVAQLHPRVAKNFALPADTAFAIIDITTLAKNPLPAAIFTEPPRFPASPRDFAFLTTKKTDTKKILNAVKLADPLIDTAEIFDIFEFKDRDEKSVGIRVKIRADDRTLRDADIDEVSAKIITAAEKADGKLREA